MSDPQNGGELLARIRPRLAEKSTRICLRPDLLDAWETANEELAEALSAETTKRQVGASAANRSAQALAEKVQKIEADIEANEIRFTFRAMTKDDWRALCDQHPPRKGNEVDQYVGYDRDSVDDAAIRKCLVDPVFDEASWAQLLEVCNPSEWSELREAVRAVNGAITNPPKSQLASRTLARGGSGSK